MGRNKALIDVGGVPLADRVASVLRRAGCDPVVAIGGDPAELGRLRTPVLPDRYPGDGPLAGILLGLEMFAADDEASRGWMVAVACDLPDLTPGVIHALTDGCRGTRGGDVPDVVVARAGRLEPAVAMWSVSALPAVAAMHERGERALHRVITGLRHVEVSVDVGALRNVNRPVDLEPPSPPAAR